LPVDDPHLLAPLHRARHVLRRPDRIVLRVDRSPRVYHGPRQDARHFAPKRRAFASGGEEGEGSPLPRGQAPSPPPVACRGAVSAPSLCSQHALSVPNPIAPPPNAAKPTARHQCFGPFLRAGQAHPWDAGPSARPPRPHRAPAPVPGAVSTRSTPPPSRSSGSVTRVLHTRRGSSRQVRDLARVSKLAKGLSRRVRLGETERQVPYPYLEQADVDKALQYAAFLAGEQGIAFA
jgi:hypothetical protein